MPIDPNTDTCSPWYECFEAQEQFTASPAPPAVVPTSAPAAKPGDDDGAIEALFDYYNA